MQRRVMLRRRAVSRAVERPKATCCGKMTIAPKWAGMGK
jgi:hypothetical protein